MLKRLFVCLSALLLTVPVMAHQPAGGQGDFVPVSQLPPADQMPAAPMVIGAYAFVWVVLVLYLWSIWRRVSKVEADLAGLAARQRSANR